MPSDRRVIAFRPDDKEQSIVDALVEKHGFSMARAIAYALRYVAEHENLPQVKAEKNSPNT